MIFNRPNPSPLLFILLKPLIFIVVISCCFSACIYASALPQPADESLQKTLDVRQLTFSFVEAQPEYMQANFRVTVPEDATWYDDFLGWMRSERTRQDSESIISGLVDRFDSISQRLRSPQQVNPPYRFAFNLVDPLPNYISDEPSPGRPFVEDYMWQLDPEFAGGEEYRRMTEEHWRPWYETFYMDGPFQMEVFYIGTDYKLYSGLIDIPAEAIRPYPAGIKVGELTQPMQFKLDFVRDLDDELEIED